jgi:hypothetical protein
MEYPGLKMQKLFSDKGLLTSQKLLNADGKGLLLTSRGKTTMTMMKDYENVKADLRLSHPND